MLEIKFFVASIDGYISWVNYVRCLEELVRPVIEILLWQENMSAIMRQGFVKNSFTVSFNSLGTW